MFTSLVWLAFGGLLQIFGFGLYTIPLAAWFVHLFMLRFSRKVKPLAGAGNPGFCGAGMGSAILEPGRAHLLQPAGTDGPAPDLGAGVLEFTAVNSKGRTSEIPVQMDRYFA